MISFFKDAKQTFKGNWLNTIIASMVFYSILSLCVMLTVKPPFHIAIKCAIGVILFIFIIIPLIHGYIRFFIKLTYDKEKVNPFILIVPSLEVSPATKIILIAAGVILVALFLLAGGGIFIASFVPPAMRLWVIIAFVLAGIIIAGYINYKLWPLFYMVIDAKDKDMDFYFSKCTKITKGGFWRYIAFHLKHLPIFVVSLLPAFLGLLVFYPIYILSKYRLYCEISNKK